MYWLLILVVRYSVVAKEKRRNIKLESLDPNKEDLPTRAKFDVHYNPTRVQCPESLSVDHLIKKSTRNHDYQRVDLNKSVPLLLQHNRPSHLSPLQSAPTISRHKSPQRGQVSLSKISLKGHTSPRISPSRRNGCPYQSTRHLSPHSERSQCQQKSSIPTLAIPCRDSSFSELHSSTSTAPKQRTSADNRPPIPPRPPHKPPPLPNLPPMKLPEYNKDRNDWSGTVSLGCSSGLKVQSPPIPELPPNILPDASNPRTHARCPSASQHGFDEEDSGSEVDLPPQKCLPAIPYQF